MTACCKKASPLGRGGGKADGEGFDCSKPPLEVVECDAS